MKSADEIDLNLSISRIVSAIANPFGVMSRDLGMFGEETPGAMSGERAVLVCIYGRVNEPDHSMFFAVAYQIFDDR